MTDKEISQIASELTKRLTDQGRITEIGWLGFKSMCNLDNAPPEQLQEMRNAFFAGAMHLFTSILAFLEPGSEPTDRDLNRMNQVAIELEQYQKELEVRAANEKKRTQN